MQKSGGEESPAGGGKRTGCAWWQNVCEGRKMWGVQVFGEEERAFFGKGSFFSGERKAPQAGASARGALGGNMFVGGVYARVRRMKTEALKGQIWQVPYLAAELLKCYERERVCYPKFRKALTGQVRASRTWRQNGWERRKMWGVQVFGKSGLFSRERKAPQAGANTPSVFGG